MTRVVVVGNGPAAHRFAERLRQHGHSGTIRILGAESRPAYNRVLLGAVLDRTLSPDAVALPELPAEVEVRLGVRAETIDRGRRVVVDDRGTSHPFDILVLATGSRPDVPEIPGLLGEDGALAEGVRPFRTLADCEVITRGHSRAVVLGGGILGVEAARSLAHSGTDVTLVHPRPHLMERQLDAACADLLAGRLAELGVRLRLGRRAVGFRPGALVLDDGDVVATGALLLCTGVRPETGLAFRAGLTVRHGVVVDGQLRTDDPDIHAIGDCAEHEGHVPALITPAWQQAETLAEVLAGRDARYRRTPSVTRLKARGIDLASVGSADALGGGDADVELVTLSDPTRGRYAKLALRDQRVTGAVLLGFPKAIAAISQLHDRDLPAPSDRLGLLLGAPAVERQAPAELPEDAVVCRCNNVTKRALVRAWHNGARHLADLARATRATTGCGGCADGVRRVCASLRSKPEPAMTEQEGAA